MRRILDLLHSFLPWFVVLVSVLLICISVLPRLFGFTACSIRDDSMAPQISRGSLVLAKPVAFADIREGDVLVFEDPRTGTHFTRNVVEVWTEKQQLVTCGADTSAAPDPWTTAYRCVVGRMQYRIPLLGYPAIAFHPFISKVVIVLLYSIWIAVELERSRASKKRGESSCA